MNILYINTSSSDEIVIGLRRNRKEQRLKRQIGTQKAQAVLPLIDRLLSKHKLNLTDIDKIQVERGPGSFTGLRVGIAIANTLGLMLRIPVNGKATGELEVPFYA